MLCNWVRCALTFDRGMSGAASTVTGAAAAGGIPTGARARTATAPVRMRLRTNGMEAPLWLGCENPKPATTRPGTLAPVSTQPTTTLWRPTGPAELKLVEESGWRAWPPRLPEQPIFYPVLNEDYAIRIARD